MFKNCPVIINNEAVTVAIVGGKEIQFPSIKSNGRYVNVKMCDGNYFITNEEEMAKPKKEPIKETKKKTTNFKDAEVEADQS